MAESVYKYVSDKLKCETKWTDDQAKIYDCLKLLLADYRIEKQIYKLNDKYADYKKFIMCRPWYNGNKNRLYIDNLTRNCVLSEKVINDEERGTRIVLFFKNFNCNLQLFHDKKLELFYGYFSHKNSKETGYFACNNPHKNIQEQNVMKIPDFDAMYKISNIMDSMITKKNFMLFIIDTIRYYCVDNQTVLNIKIGLNYNITLEQLYQQIYS